MFDKIKGSDTDKQSSIKTEIILVSTYLAQL